jgi:hypothetical protein
MPIPSIERTNEIKGILGDAKGMQIRAATIIT